MDAISFAIAFIFIMCQLFTATKAKDCVGLPPPEMGVLKCEMVNGNLQCMATCYNGQVFDTGEEVVVRNCDHVTGQWLEGNFLPVCGDHCHTKLLNYYQTIEQQPQVTASSDSNGNDVIPLFERSLLGNQNSLHWRPTVDDLSQYIQVQLPTKTRINGIVLRGDKVANYVTAFRVLFSEDGDVWYPYTDGQFVDTFFRGNSDSRSEVTRMFSCPHEARYIRINPVTWFGHVAMAFDLIGCPIESRPRRCKPVLPPTHGVINCEVDGDQILCTAYCLGDKIFEGEGPVISRSCYENVGVFDGPDFPRCVDRGTSEPPFVNITGFCMESEADCSNIDNGDYQYCGDCHYFTTCSHGYFYVRACPALLRFDSISRLCDYKSRTCESKNRRLWLAERRMQDYRNQS